MTARMVTFNSIPLWVQVWGLPFDLISKEATREMVVDWGQLWRLTIKLSHQSKLALFR